MQSLSTLLLGCAQRYQALGQERDGFVAAQLAAALCEASRRSPAANAPDAVRPPFDASDSPRHDRLRRA